MHFDLLNCPENLLVSLFLMTPEQVTDDYVSWLNSSEINQYLESRFVAHTVESTRAFVSSTMASPDTLFFGIKSKALGKHVGNVKLGPIDRYHGTCDVGILIGDKTAWGMGVATCTISVVSEIAKNHLGLRKLTAGCYISNEGSRKAFIKAGFVVEGVRPGQFLLNGRPEDLVLLGQILK